MTLNFYKDSTLLRLHSIFHFAYKPKTYKSYKSNRANRYNRNNYYTKSSWKKYRPRNRVHEHCWLWEDEQAGAIYCKYCQNNKNPRYEGNF